MAYPDTNQDRRDHVDPHRNPNAIDTRSSFSWPMVIGIAVAAVLAMTLLGSFSDRNHVTNAPVDTRPTIETPVNPPANAPTPAPTPPTP